MRSLALTYALAAILTASPLNALADKQAELVTIPLNQVWALGMPGTDPMSILRRDGKYLFEEGPLLDDIRKSLTPHPAGHTQERPRCFAVTGSADDCLDKVSDILAGRASPATAFPVGSDVNVVLCSCSSACMFRVEEVSRYFNSVRSHKPRGSIVNIRLLISPVTTPKPAAQLAVIPIAEMPTGLVHVKVSAFTKDDDRSQLEKCSCSLIQWPNYSFSGFRDNHSASKAPKPWPARPAIIPTTDIHGSNVEKTIPFDDAQLIERICPAPTKQQSNTASSQSGFAVAGTRMDALREAHQVLTLGRPVVSEFPSGSDITLVFYSKTSGTYVHLTNVERCRTDITISYQFTPHATAQVTEHIALVPLGALAPGKYSVDIVRSPTDSKYAKLGFGELSQEEADRIVCHPFSFVILEESTK